jgi:carbon monoxide dehydrogenase subunit G
MKLSNEMVVPAPLEEAWAVMLDVERVAPCLPGASVEAAEDGEYRGKMAVKIGPIKSSFEGTLRIEEADESSHRAVLSARAREQRGQGTAAATITSTMEAADEGTRVRVETDLRVTGPAAQFGRGVMQDVSAKLMDDFAECLAREMGRAEPEPTEAEPALAGPLPADVPAPPPGAGEVRWPGGRGVPDESQPTVDQRREPPAQPPSPAQDVLDLGAVGGRAVAKRLAPVALAVLAAIALIAWRRTR